MKLMLEDKSTCNKSWYRGYEVAKKYYKEHGNLKVPYNYTYKIEDKSINLCDWIRTQRSRYKKNGLKNIQIKLLEEIGMQWNLEDYNHKQWLKRYEYVKKYYEEHGNLLIPSSYIVKIDNKEVNLYYWLKWQKQKYNGLVETQIFDNEIKLLEQLNIDWEIENYREKKWNQKYELAKKYYEKHGNLLIPRSYIIKDGKKEFNLGAWIVAQRNAYKGNSCNVIDSEQIKLLEEIGMIWEVRKYNSENIDECWMKNYELAKKYYEEHENLLIERYYKVKKDGKDFYLGTWISKQRKRYIGSMEPALLDEQIKLLEQIGMIWDLEKLEDERLKPKWLIKYGLAKKYYEEHGNLLIASDHIEIVDGKVINLGDWINTQRKGFKNKNGNKINTREIELLEEIGMIWDVKAYKDIDKYLEEQYILYEKGMLDEQQTTKLLNEGIFMYSDLDKTNKLQKASALEFYRMKVNKNGG